MSLESGELKTLGLRCGYMYLSNVRWGEECLWIGEIMLPPMGNAWLLGVELWVKSNSGLRWALFCPAPILVLTGRGGLLGRSHIICICFFFFFVFPTPGFAPSLGAFMGENFGFCDVAGLVKPLSGGRRVGSRSGVCALGSDMAVDRVLPFWVRTGGGAGDLSLACS